jgi:hypothetical protein
MTLEELYAKAKRELDGADFPAFQPSTSMPAYIDDRIRWQRFWDRLLRRRLPPGYYIRNAWSIGGDSFSGRVSGMRRKPKQ